MKPTKENIDLLKIMGFTCDKDKTGNYMDEEWYSLKNGWGFRLDAIRDFSHLSERLYLGGLEKLCQEVLMEPEEIINTVSKWKTRNHEKR